MCLTHLGMFPRDVFFSTRVRLVYENLAVVGATGAVGRIALQCIVERKLPYKTIKFIASKRSAGTKIDFQGKTYTVEEICPQAFEGVDLAIASTPDEVARDFCPY